MEITFSSAAVIWVSLFPCLSVTFTASQPYSKTITLQNKIRPKLTPSSFCNFYRFHQNVTTRLICFKARRKINTNTNTNTYPTYPYSYRIYPYNYDYDYDYDYDYEYEYEYRPSFLTAFSSLRFHQS